MCPGDWPNDPTTSGPERPGPAGRGTSTAVVAGWLVMGLFLLAGLLTVLASVGAEVYRSVFLGMVVPAAVVALVVALVLLARSA